MPVTDKQPSSSFVPKGVSARLQSKGCPGFVAFRPNPALRPPRMRPEIKTGREWSPTHALSIKGSDKLEPIEIHDLIPRRHKVAHKFLLRICTRVDLRKSP